MPMPSSSTSTVAAAATAAGALWACSGAFIPGLRTAVTTERASPRLLRGSESQSSASPAGSGALSCLAAGVAVSALAGSRSGARRRFTSVSAFEGELGVQAPVGFWDPLGLAADGDVDNFKRRRAVELKHGRICMLACIGYIIPEYFRWPGFLSPAQGIKFADVPHGIAAVSKVPLEGWLQIGLFIGHYEGQFFRQDANRAPGDFAGYGFLGVGKNFIFNFDPIEFKDENVRRQKLSAEIANGRLAMVALMAMLFQNGTVGTTGPEMWLPAA
eukprot:TRINITY_DN2273_c0_g1_i1.p1 TRINITY_DN2273_c0_g1~~TRINITY_DN2273_c0_g1_i1.p1  ORF type:complete len:272 (+),score=63.58 TRINITY_DN2273_c0_g1_i1:48-863(+)